MPTSDDIAKILSAKVKIAVIGDMIIDEYRIGTVDRISPEAPVPVLFQQDVVYNLGGAGNVFRNLEGLGAEVDLYCNCNMKIAELMMTEGNNNIFHNDYPCSHKIRMMAGNHQLMRVDVEVPSDQIEWLQFKNFSWWRELTENFDKYDAIVLSDYGKGVLSDGVINTIIELAQITSKTIIVDAKNNFNRYLSEHVILKCNRKEWNAGKVFKGFKGTVVTEGEKGISVTHQNIHETFRGLPVNIVDVCGAGDTVTAVLAIGVAMGMYIFNAANVANYAAAEVCRHPKVYPIQRSDLENLAI